MPPNSVFNPADHLIQAQENERLARALIDLDSCYKDWVVTLAFYSAMHYIYSKLPGPTVPTTHVTAGPVIVAQFGVTIYKPYNKLLDSSRNARYYPLLAKQYRQDSNFSEQALITLNFIKSRLGV